MFKTTFLLFILLFYGNILLAQNQAKIDSLLKVTKSNISDKEKVDTYVGIADEYSYSDSANTAKYVNKAIALARKIRYQEGEINASIQIGWINMELGHYAEAQQIFQKMIKDADKIRYLKGKAAGLNYLGIIQEYQGNYEQALEYYFKSLKIKEELGNKAGIASSYNNIGIVYKNQGNYEKALEYYFKSLKIKEELDNKLGVANSYNNIGVIYTAQRNHEKALEYYFKSLKIDKELRNKSGIANSYNNIGQTHTAQGNYEKALEYYFKSLKIDKELGSKNRIARTYSNIGEIYEILNNGKKAIEYQLQSLEIYEELGVQDDITFPLLTLGKVYRKWKEWENARKYLIRCLALANKTGFSEKIRDAAEELALLEEAMGNYEAAYKYQVLFKKMSDSLQNDTKAKEITRLEMNYEFEQEKDSIQTTNQVKQVALEKDIENRKNMQIATFLGLGLLAILLAILFLFLQSKQRSNKLLTEKSTALTLANEEVQMTNKNLQIANEEIQTMNEELQTVNETLNITLDTVEKQKNDILSSIQYAQRIQASILPLPKYIQSLLPEHFIFFKSRDVVSGDFYWLTESNNKIILAVVDCTGHGVPGAFMSMVGNDLLNSIVKDKKTLQPDKILTQLHKDIRQVLQQKETQNIDGMDMALISLDLEKQKLEFAGAQNPLVYIQNKKLYQLKGDIMSIGGTQQEREKIFTLHAVNMNLPTTLYLFSDGYKDQFGGKKGKKFMTKCFRELLLDIHQKPMQEQKQILEQTLNTWMGKEEQVDDILVMGVRI